MKEILSLCLFAVIITACGNTKGSEKEYLSKDEFKNYLHMMDSVSYLGESYSEPVFMGIKMGLQEKSVVDAFFTLERENKITYDGKKFYFVHKFKDVDYRIEIDYDCGANDVLHSLTFEGVNPLAAPFDIKMALNDYFKNELVGAKRLQAEGNIYKDAVKYVKSLSYCLKGNRFYIVDVKLFNNHLEVSNDPGMEEAFEFEGL